MSIYIGTHVIYSAQIQYSIKTQHDMCSSIQKLFNETCLCVLMFISCGMNLQGYKLKEHNIFDVTEHFQAI